MTMTATLSLFRPSILDPVEDEGRTNRREPGFARDRSRSAPRDEEHPQLREPGSAPGVPAGPATPELRQPGGSDGGDVSQLPLGAATVTRELPHESMVQQGGGPTLDDLIVGVWEGLAAHRTVACPACGEAMSPRYSAGPAPVGGRCRSCRTTIA
jgi:hypothetical protein